MAQSRREFELNNLIMNGKREEEWSKELKEREQKIKAKMKRAEVNVSSLILYKQNTYSGRLYGPTSAGILR